MPSKHSSILNKKRKVDNASSLISYKDKYLSLDLASRLKYVICDRKFCSLTKNGRQQKNFRKRSKRNRCQQRCADDYIKFIIPPQPL